MIDSTLDAMIRERLGPQRYGVFFSAGEGSFYPDGTEESSGSVVADDGAHYSYWTDWDYGAGVEIFATWRRIDMQDNWCGCEEYRQARQAAGLTVSGIISSSPPTG